MMVVAIFVCVFFLVFRRRGVEIRVLFMVCVCILRFSQNVQIVVYVLVLRMGCVFGVSKNDFTLTHFPATVKSISFELRIILRLLQSFYAFVTCVNVLVTCASVCVGGD